MKSIIRNSFQNKEIFQTLNLREAKVSSTILPDIIVSGVPSLASLAIVVYEVKTIQNISQLHQMIKRLNEVQDQFKNSIAVLIGFQDDWTWNKLQTFVDGKTLRFLRVTDSMNAAILIQDCLNAMMNNEKLKLQSTFFAIEKEKLISCEAVKDIITKAFNKMQIPSDDQQLICEGYDSLEKIIVASKEEMEVNSPADVKSIEKITFFFGCTKDSFIV